ncbi:MAG: LytR C-terminal domain-containing protein [Pseudonocardiaceae bacterium]
MSNLNGTGASRRMRNTGLALLGLALIAVVIGVVATTNGEEETSVTAPPPVTSPQAPSGAPPPPSVIPFPPPETPSPGAAPALVPPEPAAGGPASAKGSGDYSQRRGEVRVYNNSTIRGLAARAASDLTDAGWTVVEVGNYAQGTIPTTTAYYQEGTNQQADAEALGEQFSMRVEPRFPGITNADSGLIVIVTNDYVSP